MNGNMKQSLKLANKRAKEAEVELAKSIKREAAQAKRIAELEEELAAALKPKPKAKRRAPAKKKEAVEAPTVETPDGSSD